jgi:prepilin-type N-terminal cleavage/methylation domain-containing protein
MKLTGTSGFLRKRRRSRPGRGEKGVVLIELLVAIAILGVVSVGFLSALVTGYHGVVVIHDRTTAESLTRTAFEKMRVAPFPYGDSTTPAGKFDVVVDGVFVTTGYEEVSSSDIQLITVTIRRHADGTVVLVTETTKVQS